MRSSVGFEASRVAARQHQTYHPAKKLLRAKLDKRGRAALESPPPPPPAHFVAASSSGSRQLCWLFGDPASFRTACHSSGVCFRHAKDAIRIHFPQPKPNGAIAEEALGGEHDPHFPPGNASSGLGVSVLTALRAEQILLSLRFSWVRGPQEAWHRQERTVPPIMPMHRFSLFDAGSKVQQIKNVH